VWDGALHFFLFVMSSSSFKKRPTETLETGSLFSLEGGKGSPPYLPRTTHLLSKIAI
jgi:hypothetical protein